MCHFSYKRTSDTEVSNRKNRKRRKADRGNVEYVFQFVSRPPVTAVQGCVRLVSTTPENSSADSTKCHFL